MKTKRFSKKSGQALVEMTVLVTLFLIMTMGVIEYVSIIRTELKIGFVSRDAARTLSAGFPLGQITNRMSNLAWPLVVNGVTKFEYSTDFGTNYSPWTLGSTPDYTNISGETNNGLTYPNLVRVTVGTMYEPISSIIPFLKKHYIYSTSVVLREK